MLTNNKVFSEYPNSLKMRSQNFVSGISGVFNQLFSYICVIYRGLFGGIHRTISEFYSTHYFVRDSVRLGAFVIVFFLLFVIVFCPPQNFSSRKGAKLSVYMYAYA